MTEVLASIWSSRYPKKKLPSVFPENHASCGWVRSCSDIPLRTAWWRKCFCSQTASCLVDHCLCCGRAGEGSDSPTASLDQVQPTQSSTSWVSALPGQLRFNISGEAWLFTAAPRKVTIIDWHTNKTAEHQEINTSGEELSVLMILAACLHTSLVLASEPSHQVTDWLLSQVCLCHGCLTSP